MLLKDNIQRLLKLGLGRAEFVLVKKIFRNSETLATSKQRLFFLRQCSTLNVFPKTIENLRLPYDFGVESITEKSKQRTRRFVLNESKRALGRIIAIKLHEQRRLDESITSVFTPDVASQIRSQRYLAYNTASNLHNRKFLTLLDNLKNPSSANTSENNSPNGSSDQRNRTTNLKSTDNNNTSSNISAILAILFMDRLETIALSSHLSISPYKRYVDDIYLQTTCEDMADQFHSTMNNLHPKLKFEIEKPEITPSGHSLSLLDFKVTISKDGKSSFEFYKKTAKKPIFVHHQSAIPIKSKINFIRNERKRIEDKCSTKTIARKHQNTFDDVLRLNGYPESIIDKTKHSQNHRENPRPLNTEWSYMKIPYISERLNYRITSIFRKEDIPVRVAHK